MAKRQLTEGNYVKIALIGVVAVLLIATAVSLLHQPTSKEEYLVWREGVVDTMAQMDRVYQMLLQADELAKAGNQPTQVESLRQTILEEAKTGTEAARGWGTLDVRDDEWVILMIESTDTIRRGDPFMSYRMGALQLGIFSGTDPYRGPNTITQTTRYAAEGNALRDTLRSHLIILDAYFGVR